ncbi:MAG: hypothetical protein WC601_10450 [Desulfotomaculaceae bacterium]
MSDTLIQIGTTKLYSEVTLAEVLDGHVLSEFDGLTLAEMFPVSSHKWLQSEPLQVDHYTDGRATCNFAVLDLAGEFAFRERMRILVTDLDMNRSFAGLLASAEPIRFPGSAVGKIWAIDAADFTSMLDWRVVDYVAEVKLAGDAVKDILAEFLAEEGITEGSVLLPGDGIEDGELLKEISLGNCSATVALDKLAAACPGFCWYLDYDLRLFFHSRSLYAAEWNILDSTDILAPGGESTMSLKFANPDYANSITMVGGYEETTEQHESLITDGVTKSWPLGYPVNRVSTATWTPSGGSPQALTIGQKGTDAGSYQVYYALQSETITLDETLAAATIAGAGVLEISYYGLWKAKSKAEDLTAITTNAARQGVGSGKVEYVKVDDSLTSIIAAGEYANAELATRAVDGITATYKTRRAGLAAGTLQRIVYQDVDEDFLIAHVSEETKDGDTEYTVTAYYGPVGEEWDLFFRSSFEVVQNAVSEGIEEGTGVTKLYNFSHTYEAVDRPNPFTAAPIGAGLAISSDLWPCFDQSERTEYIEFWRDGVCVFRKQHTSTPDEIENDLFHSYSFISPAEAIGEIDEVVLWGGSSASAAYGSGVELFRADFNRLKTILESYQLNMIYINADK